jgi:hypothetical protein
LKNQQDLRTILTSACAIRIAEKEHGDQALNNNACVMGAPTTTLVKLPGDPLH